MIVLAEVFPPMQGGSGRWLWELYRRLSGIDVTVLAPDAPGADAFDSHSAINITRADSWPASWGVSRPAAFLGYRRLVKCLRRVMAEAGADAVHCGRCLPEGLAARMAVRGTGVPYWCFVHGEELTLAATSRELAWLTRRVLSGAGGIVANSRNTCRLLTDNWAVPPERVRTLTPGVDTARFVPAPPDPGMRARVGWTGRRVILTVGALQQRKGQDMLIRALPAIRERCPDVLYALAGEGWERPALERLAAEHGVTDAVAFMGTPEDGALLEFYQQCDLFALPNRQVGWDFEGFGIVLLEAQACARPVVTGASGGTAETVLSGQSGLVVPCDEPRQVADACIALLDDPEKRAAMGREGRAWVQKQFDWAVLARRAEAEFRQSLAAPAHSEER